MSLGSRDWRGSDPSHGCKAPGVLAAHLIADNQLAPDLAGEAKLDALIENVLAIYRQGLARGAEPP